MRQNSRRRLLAAAAATMLLPLLPRSLRAAAPVAARLDEAERQDVQRVVDYLNGIHTLQSRFQQVAADGSDSSGTLYVDRPGRMRLQYDPPVPITIVADGYGLYYWDSQVEQMTPMRVEDTPAWFLLRPDIRADGDVTVTRFQRQPGIIQFTMVETRNPDLGSVTLTLSDKPLELRQWTVIDAQNRPVTVTLLDPRYGLPISPLTFQWIDPRLGIGHVPR